MTSIYPLDVVVVGNVGIDTNVYLSGNSIDLNIESNFTENLDYIGQPGVLVSRGYSRLGRRTSIIGHVGRELNGDDIRKALIEDGIEANGLEIDPGGTSRSINLVDPDGQQKNFYGGNSHLTLQPDLNMAESILSRTRVAHFNVSNWSRHLLPVARQQGVIIVCDIQDVAYLNGPYCHWFTDNADIIFFSSTNGEDPTPLMESLLDERTELLLIAGMGEEGCAVGNAEGIKFYPPITMELPVIDTNGTGGALATGFINSYLFQNRSLQEAALCGQIAARFACAQRASSGALISSEQLDDYFHSMRNGYGPYRLSAAYSLVV